MPPCNYPRAYCIPWHTEKDMIPFFICYARVPSRQFSSLEDKYNMNKGKDRGFVAEGEIGDSIFEAGGLDLETIFAAGNIVDVEGSGAIG
jgi:hypothetical protein